MINKDILETMQQMIEEYDRIKDHSENDFDIHFKDAAYNIFVRILKSESSMVSSTPRDLGGHDWSEDRFREELLKSLQNISYSLEKGIRIQQ